MSASWECQVAIYNALKADTTFMNAIGNRLFDEAPTNEVFPYVTIGDMVETRDNAFGNPGFEVLAEMHIYTKPGMLGFKPSKQIASYMNNVLNLKVLPLATLKMVQIYYEASDSERDEDLRILNIRYRIKIETN